MRPPEDCPQRRRPAERAPTGVATRGPAAVAADLSVDRGHHATSSLAFRALRLFALNRHARVAAAGALCAAAQWPPTAAVRLPKPAARPTDGSPLRCCCSRWNRRWLGRLLPIVLPRRS